MNGWTPELAARAERVPVWTRPARPRFTGKPAGFAAWGDGGSGSGSAYGDIDLAIEPAPPQIDAFAQGFAQGYAAGEAALDDERRALAVLAGGLETLEPEPPAELARLLATTVSRLVSQIVGEIALDDEVIGRRCAAIAGLIAEESAPSRLRVAPDDAARLDRATLAVELVADLALAPGTLVLETAYGWIEDGPALRMERLHAALDAMAATR